MISENVWRSILTAPSSSEAVERAASFSVSTLHQSRLPWNYEDLSARSQESIRAVSRAFDLAIDGVPSDRWAVWAPTKDDARLCYGWEDVTLDAEFGGMGEDQNQDEEDGTARHDIAASAMAPAPQVTAPKRATSGQEEIPTQGMQDDANMPELGAKTSAGVQDVDKEPSAVELQAAEAVRNWAQQAPHTEPPAEAVATIRKSVAASKLLMAIVSPEDPPNFRATVVGTFSEDIGATFAGHVLKALLVPYIASLTTPASREMMRAIVKFAELHWRTAVSLFEGTGKQGGINGAIGEVLVRVAGVLNTDAAIQSLRAFCGTRWGDDGIRVLETLVGKCKEEKGVAELIVSSMERNILGLESSVRFGKLIFTLVRDVPSVAESHAQDMESIIGRSKAFLAKRALKILKEKQSKANSG